jgi:hypothetical protein
MLNIAMTNAIIGKVANNIEKNGEEDVTGFSFPVQGILLSIDQVKTLLEDPYADNWLFNRQAQSGIVEPITRALEPRVLKDHFDGATCGFKMGNSEFRLTNCKVSAVTLDPENGGNTKVTLKLYVRPENDKQILAFLGYQNREVQIEIAEAKVALKGGKKQTDFIEDGAGNGSEPDGQAGKGTTATEFEKDVQKQLGGRAGAAH